MTTPLFQIPGCVIAGKHIDNIAAYHDEAVYFLDDEEWNYEWRRCSVPVNLIVTGPPIDASFVLSGATAYEEKIRFQQVRDWMADNGGAKTALELSPVILLVDAQGIVCLDGWHRLVIAQEYGLEAVPAVVGISTTPVCAFRSSKGWEAVQEQVAAVLPSPGNTR